MVRHFYSDIFKTSIQTVHSFLLITFSIQDSFIVYLHRKIKTEKEVDKNSDTGNWIHFIVRVKQTPSSSLVLLNSPLSLFYLFRKTRKLKTILFVSPAGSTAKE